mgnify:FL=1
MKKSILLIFSLLFIVFPLIEINAQLLKKLKDKQNKLGSKVAGKMLTKMPGGKTLENSANDIREYEDLNYHYKYQNDSLLIFLTFNHKLGIKGDVVLSIRNISEKEIILDNIDHKKDKKGIYDKTFNLLRKIGLSEINLFNKDHAYEVLLGKKDIMDEYYENMKGVFNNKSKYFKGDILSNKQNMLNSIKPTNDFIKKNSEVFLYLDPGKAGNPQFGFNPYNFEINLSPKSSGANVFDSNQVNIEYLIQTIDYRSYFDFTPEYIYVDLDGHPESKVLSKNQTQIVDLKLSLPLLNKSKPNPDVFKITYTDPNNNKKKTSAISDFFYYSKYLIGGEKTESAAGSYSVISNNTFPDYNYTFPERITLEVRDNTSITLVKNPNWNETWRMDNGDFEAGKIKFLQERRLDQKEKKKKKKKKKKKS